MTNEANNARVIAEDGTIIYLTQQAYVGAQPGCAHYQAKGEDAAGNEYMVIWECTDGWEAMEDESDCCDWDSYTIRAL